MKKKILSQEWLKLIACITMLIDHFGYKILPCFSVPYMVDLYYVCRIIGRISFPIYCFLLAEGVRHTHNPQRYILRLGVGAFLAELPYDLLFYGCINWERQNVMVTLTLGALMLLCMEKTEVKWLKLLLILPFAAAAEAANSNYGSCGIAMIAAFALLDRLPLQFAAMLIINLMMDSANLFVYGIPVSVQLFGMLAMIPISLYSGRKLTRSPAVQWAFYLFYPIHLLILWVILGFIR